MENPINNHGPSHRPVPPQPVPVPQVLPLKTISFSDAVEGSSHKYQQLRLPASFTKRGKIHATRAAWVALNIDVEDPKWFSLRHSTKEERLERQKRLSAPLDLCGMTTKGKFFEQSYKFGGYPTLVLETKSELVWKVDQSGFHRLDLSTGKINCMARNSALSKLFPTDRDLGQTFDIALPHRQGVRISSKVGIRHWVEGRAWGVNCLKNIDWTDPIGNIREVKAWSDSVVVFGTEKVWEYCPSTQTLHPLPPFGSICPEFLVTHRHSKVAYYDDDGDSPILLGYDLRKLRGQDEAKPTWILHCDKPSVCAKEVNSADWIMLTTESAGPSFLVDRVTGEVEYAVEPTWSQNDDDRQTHRITRLDVSGKYLFQLNLDPKMMGQSLADQELNSSIRIWRIGSDEPPLWLKIDCDHGVTIGDGWILAEFRKTSSECSARKFIPFTPPKESRKDKQEAEKRPAAVFAERYLSQCYTS